MRTQTMCLCMIVKNESHIILETLNSVKQYIDYWVICDTGSTDKTADTIQAFFDKEGIDGEIHATPWVDFGHNRSLAFSLARNKADYLWVIDADDVLIGEINFNGLSADSYYLRYGKDFTYHRNQIFNGSEEWIYKGVLHEYPVCLSKTDPVAGTIGGNYYIESRRLGARSQGDPAAKYLADAHLLEQALKNEKDPALITRYLFYTAQSYRDAGERGLAIDYYKKRADAGGWPEEVWRSKYEIGMLYEALGAHENAKKFYLEAFEYRPTRAESLYSLGKMCNVRKEFFQAQLFLEYAAKIPYPNDLLFVSKSTYDYEIAFELSISAYWTGSYKMSIDLCEKLISMKESIPPNIYEQTLKNITFSIDKINNAQFAPAALAVSPPPPARAD